MIDIYNEEGYIHKIIENGFSAKWERDAKLLTRYYKEYEHMKRSEAKAKVLKKCEEAAVRQNNPIYFDYTVQYKRFDKIFSSAWKQETPIRTLREIEIPKEVVDWFLGLEENFRLSDEEFKKIKSRNPKCTLKPDKIINWNRTKFLFTLYIWTKVQEAYIPYPQIHALNRYIGRFKEDANLNKSYNLKMERNLLIDLGFIHITRKLHVVVDFIDKYDVFKTPITDENKITISSGDPGVGDLYFPGYWLEKQKMGSFVCQECGKEFAHYGNGKNECKRKYCKECSEKLRHGKTGDFKTIHCIDCDIEVKIDKRDNKTCRCYECQEKIDIEKTRLRVQKYREKSQVTLASGVHENPEIVEIPMV